MTFLVRRVCRVICRYCGYVTLEPYFERKAMEASALHIEERANRQRGAF